MHQGVWGGRQKARKLTQSLSSLSDKQRDKSGNRHLDRRDSSRITCSNYATRYIVIHTKGHSDTTKKHADKDNTQRLETGMQGRWDEIQWRNVWEWMGGSYLRGWIVIWLRLRTCIAGAMFSLYDTSCRTAHKGSLQFPVLNRSEYSLACLADCRKSAFYDFCLLGSFSIIFPQSSSNRKWRVTRTVDCTFTCRFITCISLCWWWCGA